MSKILERQTSYFLGWQETRQGLQEVKQCSKTEVKQDEVKQLQDSDFQLGSNPPHRHPGDMWLCAETFLIIITGRVLLRSSGQRPRMLPNVLQGTGQAPATKSCPTHSADRAEVENPAPGQACGACREME